MSFRFHKSTPSWQGMMHLLYKECKYPGKYSEQYLPMINMNPGDKTCILSTLDYLCSLSSKYNMPTIITFDQQLFWKATEIVNAVTDDRPIRDVILLLGTFHTFMNVLGAIGTLMDGTGLKEMMETVYGENAGVQMISGKAVQRAFRGHQLVDQCLTRQIVAKIMEDEPGFQDQVEELERLYMLMETGECDLHSLLESDCIDRIHNSNWEKGWTGKDLQNRQTMDKLSVYAKYSLGTCFSWSNGVLGDASQCYLSLSANIRCRWPSELFKVGSSISPEDVYLERRQSWSTSEVPLWVSRYPTQQPILAWSWLRSCDRADTNALTQKPRRVDAREWHVRAAENSLGHIIFCVIPLQPHHTRSYRKKLCNKWTT